MDPVDRIVRFLAWAQDASHLERGDFGHLTLGQGRTLAQNFMRDEREGGVADLSDPFEVRVVSWDGREGPWRASCTLAAAYADGPGVLGSSTEAGPWACGYGRSVGEAVAELERVLGRLHIWREGRERSPRED